MKLRTYTRAASGTQRAAAARVHPNECDFKIRTEQFALDVMALGRLLPTREPALSLSRQLVRSATGVGACFQSTCPSRSETEFIVRVGVALEEVDEAALWLEIVAEREPAAEPHVLELLDEANELCATLAAARMTAEGALRDAEGVLPGQAREYASRPPT